MSGGEGEDALSKLVLASFVEESAEHAHALKRDALRLEAASGNDRAEVLHLLFRTVHTVKGASRAAGILAVESATHVMEDLLESLRAKPEILTTAHVSRILALGDALEHVGPQLARTGTLEGSDVERDLNELLGAPPSVRASLTAAEPTEDASGAIRLSLGRADALIALATALDDSIVRAVAAAAAANEDTTRTSLNFDRRRISRLSHSLVTAARDLRQMPFSAATLGLDRVAREAALATGRDVAFEVSGGEVGFDREIVRTVREALIHLVRNAIDHGCEPPEERVRNGKTARATVRVEARVRGSDLVVSVEDDGRGFDVEKLRAASRSGSFITDEEAVQAAFIPGVTTSPVVTVLSGRGIGLDVVRKRVEDLRGAIAVSFRAGRGTKISLTVPMRRSSVRAVTALAGTSLVAIPTPAIERLLRVPREKLTLSGGRLVLPDPRGPIAVADLAVLLGEPPSPASSANVMLVLLASHGRTAALVVSDLMEEREVPVSALPSRLAGARLVSGITTPSSGRLALVMHTGELIEQANGVIGSLAPTKDAAAAKEKLHILLADDSLTTRTLERSILESAGFVVLTAGDGEEALELLSTRRVDAVVSDVEMPKVDGFELTARIRGTSRFNALPIILVTGRASEDDRKKGLEAGANAYIVKRAFDQELLIATLRRLL